VRDVVEFCDVLSCEVNPYAAAEAVRELALKSFIRLGHAAISSKSGLHDILEIPSKILQMGKAKVDAAEPWARVSEALYLSRKDELPLSEFRVKSQANIELLRTSLSVVLENLPEDLHPMREDLAIKLSKINDRIRGGLRQWVADLEPGGVRDIVASVERQFSIFNSLKKEGHASPSSWTLITDQEEFLIHAMYQVISKESLPNVVRNHTLEQCGLRMTWSSKRERFEPAFKNSHFKNSTLFDLSSKYFDSLLDKLESNPSNSTLTRFITDLRDLRLEFEREGIFYQNRERLHSQQKRIFNSLFGEHIK